MCVVPDIIKGHADARDLSHHLGPYWIPRAMLMLGLYQSEWPSGCGDIQAWVATENQLWTSGPTLVGF